MKKLNSKILVGFIIAVAFHLFNPTQAQAQKFKVKKVKGRSALIETSVPLEEGKTYELQTEVISTDVNYSNTGFKSRQNSFTLGVDLSYLKGDTAQNTSYDVQARYGWNFSYIEFGVVGRLKSVDRGSGATTDFAAGGYFDYNLVTNRDSKNLIYGPFGLLTLGTLQSTGGASANLIDLNAGGFVSLFFAQSSAALRFELYADVEQVSSSVGQNTLTGAGGRGLIIVYF
ncbi:MAG: hypothetical protein H7256_07375 [Bdellovibrio sp.]|nr:hypothetical protein [Bdellovibrio sp.]